MRGDLVYEKLGEIDPALVAEALPEAAPMPELYRLGGNNPPPPKKRPNFRKALVICACLLLAGILLLGGSIALSRTVEFPSETETTETPSDQGNELAYQGIVTIGGFGPLTDSDDLESMGNEIKARFSAATHSDVCDCIRDLNIQIGENSLTYNRDHGCFRDGDTGKVYRLRDEDRAYMEDLLAMLEPPVIMDYTHATLHPLDAYTCTVSLVENEKFPNIFKVKEIYLRPTAEGSDYRTDGFREIPDRDSFYCGTIPEDAPLGDYELVVSLFTPYTGRYTELTLTSPTPAVTVAAHEKEPRYAFFYECEEHVFPQGEMFSLTAGLINRGDDIYRWSTELSILPTVTLRTVRDGETLTYPMTTGLELDWSGDLYHMTYNEPSKADFWTVTPDLLPLGVYDLVLSFEGHEEVYPRVIAIVDPNAPHGFTVDYSFTPKDGTVDDSVHIVTNNGAGIFSLRITHAGDTLYRYGDDDCLRPDSVKLYRQEEGTEGESVPIFYTSHTEKPLILWAWENDETKSFLYEWDWSREPIEPGTYTLQVIYRDGEGGIQLHLTLEGALTVVAP